MKAQLAPPLKSLFHIPIKPLFSPQEIEELLALVRDSPPDAWHIEDTPGECKQLISSQLDSRPIHDRLLPVLLHANRKHWKFDLHETELSEPPAIFCYNRGGFQWAHTDYHDNAPNPKLTAVVNIQQAEEGGILVIDNKHPIHLELGQVVIFPSFLLHEITKVKRGRHVSLTAWISGPPFK